MPVDSTMLDRVWIEILNLTQKTTELTNQLRWLTWASLLIGSASLMLSFVVFVLMLVRT